jgi:hypothetical protein
VDGATAIEMTFTDKPVTACGGVALFVACAARIGLRPKLAAALPFVLTSPKAPPHQIVLTFLAGDRCHAVVTTLRILPEAVRRPYNGRADRENRMKELPPAFEADGVCSRRFSGIEAALRFIALHYNLVGELQRSLGQRPMRTPGPPCEPTPLACGALLRADGRQPLLRLSRAQPWQATFLAYLQRLLQNTANCNAVPAIEATV